MSRRKPTRRPPGRAGLTKMTRRRALTAAQLANHQERKTARMEAGPPKPVTVEFPRVIWVQEKGLTLPPAGVSRWVREAQARQEAERARQAQYDREVLLK